MKEKLRKVYKDLRLQNDTDEPDERGEVEVMRKCSRIG